jgi:hypothetical protein
MHALEPRGQAIAPSPCGSQAASTPGGRQKNKQILFKIVLTVELEDEDRVHLARTDYISSDGVGVTVIHNEFPSELAAQEYLEKALAKALKVAERGEKRDKAGKVVGKRAKAVLPTGKPDEPVPAILFTYGRDFYEIQSYSPRHSHIMEMRITSSN